MKRPFDIDLALRRIREAVAPFAKAAMFELADDGYDSPFEQLVACIISIRTRDEVSLPVARRLFAVARTADQVSRLAPREIDDLIHESSFHERKAVQIHEIARRVVQEHGGELPCDAGVVLEFAGVGPKCANLALGIACRRRGIPVRFAGESQPDRASADDPGASGRVIAVDIHVHRVTNRWGYVQARTPEQTMVALEATLPPRYDVEINELLVPFGKHMCTGVAPKCSTCPVLMMCQQVGVRAHR